MLTTLLIYHLIAGLFMYWLLRVDKPIMSEKSAFWSAVFWPGVMTCILLSELGEWLESKQDPP